MSPPPTQGDDLSRFLDSASGLPLSPTARSALDSGLRHAWHDPSRRYAGARVASQVLEQSRAAVATVLGCPPSGVVFTPDVAAAWESAVLGLLPPQGCLVVSAVEDLHVLRLADAVGAGAASVRHVAVDRFGRAAAEDVLASAAPGAVVCLQAANIEIGTRQPIQEVAGRLPDSAVLVMDSAAVLGRDVVPPGWDALIADPRMWGGPPGVAILALRDPDGMRPPAAARTGRLGVEPADPPVPLIAAAALSLESAVADAPRISPIAFRQVELLRDAVASRIPDVQVLGHPTQRVGHIAMFSFLYVAADELVDRLAALGWAVSSGASCTSDTRRPHHVLVAIGASTHGSLRVSVPPDARESDVLDLASDLVDVVAQLRREAGVTDL